MIDTAHSPRRHAHGRLKAAMLCGASLAIFGALGTMTPVAAQPDTSGAIDEITVTVGTRVKGRTVLETSVPVDVLNTEDIFKTGATETGRAIQALAPSFNFSSSSISDGTDALRPATLRGLGPDQTLVLINGKRRHTSALIHVNTSVGRGTAGTDINAIPQSAISSIEVLRDGAAAQYGSDAIAGVINFHLKDNDEGGTVSAQYGSTYEGDGDTFTASINKGFSLPQGGFLNLTYEFRDRENTNRAGLSGTRQYFYLNEEAGCDPATTCILDPREFTFNRKNFRIGDGDSRQHVGFLNARMPLSDIAEGYAFVSISRRTNEAGGFYRRVTQPERTVIELYPDGFLPLIKPTINDRSAVVGIEWTLGEWSVDTSINYGFNSFNFTIANSANASLGVNSPTTADAGTLELQQWVGNIDILRDFDWNGRPVTLAAGAEWRQENYRLEAGEPASYIDGGAVNTNCPGCDPTTGGTPVTYSPGFQVFRGFAPANEVDESRNSYSLYAELEGDIVDRLTASAAVRYEYFDDFGSTVNGKGSLRFEVNDAIALRGAVSTGFRAPSMQQKFFNSTSTQFVTVGMATVAQEVGTFRNDSPLARALGIPELKEETSMNYSIGFVFTPTPDITLTVDAYRIDIDDRIIITGKLDKTSPSIAADPTIVAAFDSVGAGTAQFFTNGADTKTRGVDIVGTYNVPVDVFGGELKLSGAGNYTKTDVKRELPAPGLLAGLDIFTAQDQSILEEWQPRTRINLTADWSNGPWSFTVRGSRYGKYTVCEGACDMPTGGVGVQNVQTFSAKWLTDLQINYDFLDKGVRITLGANNIFDVTPDKNLIGQSRGGRLVDPITGTVIVDSPGVFKFSRRSAPFGFNGGYYYARVSVDF